MRAIRATERRNVTALMTYGTEGLHSATMTVPRSGPTIQASVSIVCNSEFAFVSSSSGTRFGSPASAAARNSPVATPATPASATIAVADPANGRAANTPKRMRSDAIISLRRESLSTSGPRRNPMTTMGRKSAMSSPATQRPEPVRAFTSRVSATAAT